MKFVMLISTLTAFTCLTAASNNLPTIQLATASDTVTYFYSNDSVKQSLTIVFLEGKGRISYTYKLRNIKSKKRFEIKAIGSVFPIMANQQTSGIGDSLFFVDEYFSEFDSCEISIAIDVDTKTVAIVGASHECKRILNPFLPIDDNIIFRRKRMK